jgi:hypothetical protein
LKLQESPEYELPKRQDFSHQSSIEKPEDLPKNELRASEVLRQKIDYNNYLKQKISQSLANRP